MGQFYGSIAQRWAADAVVVNRLEHNQARALPSHAHQAGFVSLMLRGQYRETAGFLHFGYQPFPVSTIRREWSIEMRSAAPV